MENGSFPGSSTVGPEEPLDFACPHCGARVKYTVGDFAEGRTGNCTSCGARDVLPLAAPAE